MKPLYLQQMKITKEGLEHVFNHKISAPGTYTLGRETNDHLHHPFISMRHIELFVVSPTEIILRDLRSLNGTFWHGHRLEPYTDRHLNIGDWFSLGEISLGGMIFELAEDTKHTPRKNRTIPLRAFSGNASSGNAIALKNVYMSHCVVAGGNVEVAELQSLYTLTSTDNKLTGDYRAIRKFKKIGGEGEVYQAIHEETGQIVVLKTYRMHDANREKEAQLMECFDHPNIVKYCDFGEAFVETNGFREKKPRLCMEYVQGDDLEDWCKNNKDLRKNSEYLKAVVIWLIQISQVLIYLHQKKIYHRDVKPANIVLEDFSRKIRDLEQLRPVLIDFGLARAEEHTRYGNSQYAGTGDFRPKEKLNRDTDPIIIAAQKNNDKEKENQRLNEMDRNHDSYALGKTMFLLMGQQQLDSYLQHTLDEQTAEEENERCTDIEVFKNRLLLWRIFQKDFNGDWLDLKNRVLRPRTLALDQLYCQEKQLLANKLQKNTYPFCEVEVLEPGITEQQQGFVEWPIICVEEDAGNEIIHWQNRVQWLDFVLQPGIVLVGTQHLEGYNIEALQQQWQEWDCGENDPRTWYLKALQHEQSGDDNEALECYRQAAKNSSSEQWLPLCVIRMQQKKQASLELTRNLLENVIAEMENIADNCKLE